MNSHHRCAVICRRRRRTSIAKPSTTRGKLIVTIHAMKKLLIGRRGPQSSDASKKTLTARGDHKPRMIDCANPIQRQSAPPYRGRAALLWRVTGATTIFLKRSARAWSSSGRSVSRTPAVARALQTLDASSFARFFMGGFSAWEIELFDLGRAKCLNRPLVPTRAQFAETFGAEKRCLR